jgi:hypothetical protein
VGADFRLEGHARSSREGGGRRDAGDRTPSICYDPDMAHRLELAAKGLSFERVATGGFVAIAPSRAIGVLTTPGYDTESARYVARLLGIRQVVLGVMLWQARNDRAWLRQVATLNALIEAAATLASVGKRRDGRPSAAPAVAALATSAAFLALRAAASRAGRG